jgi:hypothetical protein
MKQEMASADELRNAILKYWAETMRLNEEEGKKSLRAGRYQINTQWKDEDAWWQWFNDSEHAKETFEERLKIQRKMLIEYYEKLGIADAAKVADENWRRLGVEVRMRYTELLEQAEKARDAQAAKAKRREGKEGNKKIPRPGIEEKTFIYVDILQKIRNYYFIAKTGDVQKALNYKKSRKQFQRDLHNNCQFIKYPILEIRNRLTGKSTGKLAIRRSTDQFSDVGSLITKITGYMATDRSKK